MTTDHSKPIVVVTERLDDAAVAWLGDHAAVISIAPGDDAWPEHLAQARGLIVRTYTNVTRSLLDGAPQLKVVGRAGAGLDNIDVDACRARNVEVVYRPEANTQAVVEYVFALLADALRPRVTLGKPVDAGVWTKLRAETVGERQMSELTLGILGMGRIGSRVAQVGAAYGCSVIYNDLVEIVPERRHGAMSVSAEELFERSDVVSLHVDGRASNRHFVGEALLGRLKVDAVLINTCRGFVIDSAALAASLKKNPDQIALLDVHEDEPFDATYPLLGLPNARLYPHLASRTKTAMAEMSWVVRDVVAVLEGREGEFRASDDSCKHQ